MRGKTFLLRIWSRRTGAEVLDGASLAGFPDVTSPGGVAVDEFAGDRRLIDEPCRHGRQDLTELGFSMDGAPYPGSYAKPAGAAWQQWPFDQPFYFILNLAVGGSWGGQQGVNAAAFASLTPQYATALLPFLTPDMSGSSPSSKPPTL